MLCDFVSLLSFSWGFGMAADSSHGPPDSVPAGRGASARQQSTAKVHMRITLADAKQHAQMSPQARTTSKHAESQQ